MPYELTTVADDLVVFHELATHDTAARAVRFEGLTPDTAYSFLGFEVRTLPRPGGAHLSTVATVNDVHFGEAECGVIEGVDAGPVLHAEPGAPSYPEVMNRGAISEISALAPDAVIVKGDLTSEGSTAEYRAFLDHYGPAFGDRLTYVRGNHDAYHGQDFAAGARLVDLPGVRCAVLDTAWPGHANGRIDDEQLQWLDALAAEAQSDGVPVLLFGHHHAWDPDDPNRDPDYFGITPDSSDALLALVARRPAIIGYFAGHTHRNRVRRFPALTGAVPFAEVGCVKDFPGSWAEYRVYEGGVLQIHHRISTPDALEWSERCRALYRNFIDYSAYALGAIEDRCFPIGRRP